MGLELLGRCSYDPAAPNQSYFTIGQLVSVIALLLTFSQLTKPIIRFRLQARETPYTAALIISGIAIISVFIGAILPFIPGRAWPLLGYPVFWEVLSGALLVLVAAVLITAISNKPIFKSGKAKAYLDACTAVIAKGNDDDLRELADEILPAVKPIFDECKSHDRQDNKENETAVPESTRFAFTILDLWSDRSFCRSIVCKAPSTAIEIFSQVLGSNQHRVIGYALTQQLLNQAFVNQDSILMREEDYSGLGFFKKFRNTIFGHWKFVEGNHRPLQAWRSYEKDIQPWQVKKYIECLNASVQAYISAGDFEHQPSSLLVGVNHLGDFAIQQIGQLRHMDKQHVFRSTEYKILDDVQDGLEEVVKILEQRHDELPDDKFNADGYDRFKDNSIYGIVAYGIYHFLEHIAMILRHDRAIRYCAISIWLCVFGVSSSQQSKVQVAIGKRLILHLNKKIDENLNPEKRYYPAITRLLISLLGVHEHKDTQESGARIEDSFHRMFINRLKHDYPKLVKTDLQLAEDLLPEDVTYDSAKNEILHKPHRQPAVVLKLISPGG